MYAEKEKIQPANVSKHNSNGEKQVILLVISDGKMALSSRQETVCIIKKNNF